MSMDIAKFLFAKADLRKQIRAIIQIKTTIFAGKIPTALHNSQKAPPLFGQHHL